MPQGQGGHNQPAPFLRKTYDLVSDTDTDAIISWGQHGNSFVVWKPAEFARDVLPKYFKHNNFSSFVRQLNTYGFRKVDPDNWEFVNEGFLKHDHTALSRITRRKPSTLSVLPRKLADGSRAVTSSEDSPTFGRHSTPSSAAAGVAFGRRAAPLTAAAFGRSSAFSRSMPQEHASLQEEDTEPGPQLPSLPLPQGKGWDGNNLALGGLQRFGRLVDNVLKADREGLVNGTAPPNGDSATSSGTVSEEATRKRRRSSDGFNGYQPETDGAHEEELPSDVPVITRPRAGHLETMTQSLLSDLAGQNRQIQDLTAEVQALKSQKANGQGPQGPRRRGRPPGTVGDWHAVLEEAIRSTDQLAEQVADQAAANEEVWASHQALEARLARTEERMCAASGGQMKDAGRIMVASELEKRLDDQEHAHSAMVKENRELRARVKQLEITLKAEQELADIRVWRAMLQASSMNGGVASLAETLQRMIEVASNRVGSVFAAAKASSPEGREEGVRQEPRSEAGALRPQAGDARAEGLASMPSLEEESGGQGSDKAAAAKMVRRGQPLPGSMAALGFTCSPKNQADGITSRLLGRAGSRGRKRATHADRASGRFNNFMADEDACQAGLATTTGPGQGGDDAPENGRHSPSPSGDLQHANGRSGTLPWVTKTENGYQEASESQEGSRRAAEDEARASLELLSSQVHVSSVSAAMVAKGGPPAAELAHGAVRGAS